MAEKVYYFSTERDSLGPPIDCEVIRELVDRNGRTYLVAKFETAQVFYSYRTKTDHLHAVVGFVNRFEGDSVADKSKPYLYVNLVTFPEIPETSEELVLKGHLDIGLIFWSRDEAERYCKNPLRYVAPEAFH